MRIFRIMPVLLACCLLAACQGGAGPDRGPASPPPAADVKKPVFLMVPKEKSNPYMIKMYEGFSEACAEFGAEPRFGAVEVNTAQAQIDIINQAVAGGGVSAVAVAANDADKLEPALKAAMRAGVQIISLDSSVNRNSRKVHIQQASPEIIGRALIQATAQMTGGKAVVGLISTTPYATNQNIWISWMLQEMNDFPDKYRDFHLLPIVYGEDLPGQSREAAQTLLKEHPELTVIITPSAVSMLAVGQVLREQHSRVIFTGLGLPSEIAPFIEGGSCPWMYLWNPIDIGYLAAWTAEALHTGGISGAEGDFFTAGRLGQRVVTKSADGGTEILLGDPLKFDKDNIEEWKNVF